ncbi:MAG: EpsG family protein [Lachnospiraceae bacterium]|nr:EpsG family protein [Lachnospiraceae bacterium]
MAKIRVKPNTLYHISLISLILIAGFRTISVGTDTLTYNLMFLEDISIGYYGYVEKGWVYLEKLAGQFTSDYNMFLCLISTLTICPLAFVWNKYSTNKQLSLFIYFATYYYCMSLNIMRQCLAMSIILVAYKFILENKKLYFLLFVLIASQIHTSAFFVLPVFFIERLKITNPKFVYATIFLSLVIGITPFYQLFSSFTGGYNNYMQDSRSSFYLFYLSNIAYSMIFLFVYNKSNEELKSGLLFKIYFIGVIILNVFSQIKTGTRIAYNYTIVQTILLPFFFQGKQNLNAEKILTTYLISYFMVMILKNSAEIYPYDTLLFEYLGF